MAGLSAVEEISALLEPGAVVPVFQPIVRLSDGHVIGYEALARMPGAASIRPPHDWFALAEIVGLRVDLEMACWAAVALVGAPPDDAMLFVNTSPVTLVDRRLEVLGPSLPERLVLELTEQDAVSDYELLKTRLESWSNGGVRLAIDDTGAGYSSLRHVLQLSPEFLKLDRSLIQNIDRERSRRALVWSLVAFAREVGATVIAEGVERREELDVLREAGVHLAQGFLLGKPAPPWSTVSLDVDAACVVGERMCVAARAVLAPFGASLSIGITVPLPGEPSATYLDRADRVLYAAKRATRGSVAVG